MANRPGRRRAWRPAPSSPTLRVRSDLIVLAGCVIWGVILLALLAVPAWHSGPRSWWPWVAVSGLGFGVPGFVFVRRGRGTAAEASFEINVD